MVLLSIAYPVLAGPVAELPPPTHPSPLEGEGQGGGCHPLIHHRTQSGEGTLGQIILGVDPERLLVAFERLVPLPLLLVDASQIQVGERRALVPLGARRFLQPLDRVVELALLDQVGPDVVVWITEVGVHCDGAVTVLDRLVQHPHEAVSPSAERIGFGCRIQLDGFRVEFDRLLELALHLALVGLLEEVPCGLLIVLGFQKPYSCLSFFLTSSAARLPESSMAPKAGPIRGEPSTADTESPARKQLG